MIDFLQFAWSDQIRYDWSGSALLDNTSARAKRWVFDVRESLYLAVTTDLRTWIPGPDCWEIRRALDEMVSGLNVQPASETFDDRAFNCWRYITEVRKIEYVVDSNRYLPPGQEIWQTPAETLTLRRGDCEDLAFLLASLLCASGISGHSFRFVWGGIQRQSHMGIEGHAWVNYKDLLGVWRVLDATDTPVPIDAAPPADQAVLSGSMPRYYPLCCLNREHVWSLRPEINAWNEELITVI